MLWPGGAGPALGAVVLFSDQSWKADIQMEFSPEIAASAQSLEQKLHTIFSSHIQPQGASYRLQQQSSSETAIRYNLSLEGREGLSRLQKILYAVADPTLFPVEGPVALELTGRITPGELIPLTLEANPATGYYWEITAIRPQQIKTREAPVFRSKSDLLGAPLTQTLLLEGTGYGEATVQLTYRRPWVNGEKPKRKTVIQVPELGLISDLSNPTPSKRRPLHSEPAGFADEPRLEPTLQLTTSFDWRNVNGQNYLPPIRNQGSCGSCWAFGTVGPFESLLKIKQGLSVDFSEQYLVSCNSDGWDCGGGWWAHPYHLNKKYPGELDFGAVTETLFPYSGKDLACNAPHDHAGKITHWGYVGTSYSVPSVSAMKNAISTYGPVAAAVCVGPAFSNYRGGIFATDEKYSTCGGGVNHAILLVGWDDASDTWILRNSWGTSWGEGGYMRIQRNISNVGYSANYIGYDPPVTPPPVTPPPGDTQIYRTFLPMIASGNKPCTDIPCNGNFESGSDGTWVEGSVTGLPIILNLTSDYSDYGLYNHGGSYSAWLGGVEGEINTLTQQVTIPAGASLEYWYWIDSADSLTLDFGYVYLGDTLIKKYELDQNQATSGWVQEHIDLASHQGFSGNLIFKVTTDANPDYLSSLFLDDITIDTPTGRQRLEGTAPPSLINPAIPRTGPFRKDKLAIPK